MVGNHSKKLRFVGIIKATPLSKINTMPTLLELKFSIITEYIIVQVLSEVVQLMQS